MNSQLFFIENYFIDSNSVTFDVLLFCDCVTVIILPVRWFGKGRLNSNAMETVVADFWSTDLSVLKYCLPDPEYAVFFKSTLFCFAAGVGTALLVSAV